VVAQFQGALSKIRKYRSRVKPLSSKVVISPQKAASNTHISIMQQVILLSSLVSVLLLSPTPAWAFFMPHPSSLPCSSKKTLLRMVASEDVRAPLSQDLDDSTSSSVKKVCVITGASQGLGQAMAYELAKYGHYVVVNYFPGCQESAQATVDQIELLGGDGMAVPADCTQPEQLKTMFDQIIDHYGKVDGTYEY
jgi:hypothetical protein